MTCPASGGIFLEMDFDISSILKNWNFESGPILARRFIGTDGKEKVQLRVDLGLLQMNVNGRPDGRRFNGFETVFDLLKAKLQDYTTAHGGDDDGFVLSPEECAKLHQEAIQYHQRYVCLLHMEDYDRVIRDTKRNLKLFEFVDQYADSDELAWSLNQYRPQLLLMQVRASGELRLRSKNHAEAIKLVEQGLARIKSFFESLERPDLIDQSDEIHQLELWLEELREKRPLTEKEQLEQKMAAAVEREDYEQAAEMRDAIRELGKSNANH